MENIDATNSNVGVVYDNDSKELVLNCLSMILF